MIATVFSPVVHVGVVGDKKAPFEHLFHHRMPPFGDLNGVGEVHLRPAVACSAGHAGKGGQHIHLGRRRRRALDVPYSGGGLLPDGAEELVLQRGKTVLRGEDGVLHVLELLGDNTARS